MKKVDLKLKFDPAGEEHLRGNGDAALKIKHRSGAVSRLTMTNILNGETQRLLD
jgi:hypothetical protein